MEIYLAGIPGGRGNEVREREIAEVFGYPFRLFSFLKEDNRTQLDGYFKFRSWKSSLPDVHRDGI